MKVKHILIGSRALVLRHPDFKLRPDTDWDIVTNEPKETFTGKVEVHSFDVLLNRELDRYTDDLTVYFQGECLHVLTLKGLAIVKRSHLWRDYFFDKHMTMYDKFLRDQVQTYTEQDKDYLERRTKAHYLYFKERHPNLNQSVEGFFDDYVTKKYIHDWLHSLFAYNEQPMYTYMQTDKTKAWCEKQLWDCFSHEHQLQAVAEEAYVIATERYLVPQEWNYSPKRAYFNAVNKICTTLCSGWFRDFAIDNYREVMLHFDLVKFDTVKSVLEC